MVENLETHYLVDGQVFQRVSRILDVINKPGLNSWKTRNALERVQEVLLTPDTYEQLNHLWNVVPDGARYRGWVKELVQDAEKAPDERAGAAADRGTSVHEEIAAALAGHAQEEGLDRPPSPASSTGYWSRT